MPPQQAQDTSLLSRIPLFIFAQSLGQSVMETLEFLGDFATFWGQSLRRAVTPPWRWNLIVDQLYLIGVRSFPIALVTAIFVGMVMVLQMGEQLIKFGSKNYVPSITWIANTRAMIPAFVSIVVGARVAASITAELGTMRVTEQIDALEVLNVDAQRYLVVPRLIAMTIMLPLIVGLTLYGAYAGGTLVGKAALNIDYFEYYMTSKRFAYMSDFMGGLFKCIIFGSIIALTGSYFGFNTRGGAEGVGRATTNSVVTTLLIILTADYILTSFILAVFGIGG